MGKREMEGWPEEKGHVAAAAGELGEGRAGARSWPVRGETGRKTGYSDWERGDARAKGVSNVMVP